MSFSSQKQRKRPFSLHRRSSSLPNDNCQPQQEADDSTRTTTDFLATKPTDAISSPRRHNKNQKLSNTWGSPSKYKVLASIPSSSIRNSNNNNNNNRLFQCPTCSRSRRVWCQRVVVASILLRFVWYFGVLHSRVLTVTTTTTTTTNQKSEQQPTDEIYDYIVLTTTSNHHIIQQQQQQQQTLVSEQNHEQEEELAAQKDIQERQRARQDRTRPPPSTHQVLSGNVYPRFATEILNVTQQQQQTTSNSDWISLCDAAGLNESSRVLLTNVFAPGSIGPALGLILSHHCHVRTMTLADPLLPNLPSYRMEMLSKYYVHLQHQIPHLQLIVPKLGLSTSSDANTTCWLSDLAPTHIVHLPASTLELSLAPFMSEASIRMYQTQNANTALEQLLRQSIATETRFLQVLLPTRTTTTSTQTHNDQCSAILLQFFDSQRSSSSSSCWNQLELPITSGPAVVTMSGTLPRLTNGPVLYIEDAVKAILTALQSQQSLKRFVLANDIDETALATTSTTRQKFTDKDDNTNTWSNEKLSTMAWSLPERFLYSESDSISSLAHGRELYRELLGIQQTLLPCVSSCSSSSSMNTRSEKTVTARLPTMASSSSPPPPPSFSSSATCTASVWDQIAPVSRFATANCTHVVYTVNFDPHLDTLPQPESRSKHLICRIAFVLQIAPLVQSSLAEIREKKTVDDMLDGKEINGKIEINDWIVVWVPTSETKSLSDIDIALPLIDPSQLFATSVTKALYAEREEFTEAPDKLLSRIIQQIDRPAFHDRKIKEFRSGINIFRWVPVPDALARKVVLFIGEAVLKPANVTDFSQQEYVLPLPPAQLTYYQLVEQLIQSDSLRPESELEAAVYNSLPYLWTDLSVLTHELTGGKKSDYLRCSWLDEYLTWGSNRGAEELSLAFVLGRWRLQGTLGISQDKHGWMPLLENLGESDSSSLQQRIVVNEKDEELFLRVLKRRSRGTMEKAKGSE